MATRLEYVTNLNKVAARSSDGAGRGSMRTYTRPHWLKMGTPRHYRGQPDEHRYGVDLESGLAVRSIRDSQTGKVEWAVAELTEEALGALESYDAGGQDEAPRGLATDYEPVQVIEER
jgi:hypothetical protein